MVNHTSRVLFMQLTDGELSVYGRSMIGKDTRIQQYCHVRSLGEEAWEATCGGRGLCTVCSVRNKSRHGWQLGNDILASKINIIAVIVQF